MRYETYTLGNGLRVIGLRSASPVVYCGYVVCAGTRDEAPGEEGMAHFCEHLSFKGTARRKSVQVLSCLESVGGDLNAFTAKEDTTFHAAVLREHVGRAVGLLTDIVFHSTYPQAELEREVEVVCDEIESYNDSPAELIYDEFEDVVFAGHPLGHNILGRAEHLRGYVSDDARRFTRRLYRPENAVFFVYGDVDFGKVVRMLERETSDFAQCSPQRGRAGDVALPPYEPREMKVDKGTHQAHVMVGCRAYGAHDPRRMPLYLMNNMLGGPAMSARLNIALREKRGLVYSVDSSMVCYSDTGLWCTYFGCDHGDAAKCRRLVGRELDRMVSKPLSEARLQAAKRQIKGQIGVACDNREGFALDFGKSYLHYGREKDIDALFAKIDAVTAEDIQTVAQDLFGEGNLTTLVFA